MNYFYESTNYLEDPDIYYALGLIDFKFMLRRFIETQKEKNDEQQYEVEEINNQNYDDR